MDPLTKTDDIYIHWEKLSDTDPLLDISSNQLYNRYEDTDNELDISETVYYMGSGSPAADNGTASMDDDTGLSWLSILAYDLDQQFVKSQKEYQLTISSDVESIYIEAGSSGIFDQVIGDGWIDLTDKKASCSVELITESGSSCVYTIKINYLSPVDELVIADESAEGEGK